jgi:hypothetical protein
VVPESPWSVPCERVAESDNDSDSTDGVVDVGGNPGDGGGAGNSDDQMSGIEDGGLQETFSFSPLLDMSNCSQPPGKSSNNQTEGDGALGAKSKAKGKGKGKEGKGKGGGKEVDSTTPEVWELIKAQRAEKTKLVCLLI